MNTELKNTYENLIQEMIIDGIDGMTPEIKDIIQNAPVEKRRSMVLTILEENNTEHRLLCNKIQQTVDTDNYSEMNHIKDVVTMLRDYVKIAKTEVKTKGEVMTPISLVEEMLDTLPYDVWTNPNLKWLDPCGGVGTFFSVVIERLMKGLISFQPDEKLRYKHILENMIYTCELQAKNLFLFLYAFDPKDEYALNIYNGSYLTNGFDKQMEFWGVDKFNVVVMNPPYNTTPVNGKTHSLWDKFVIKTISQLVEGGYMVAVHPSGWRNVKGMFKDIQNLLKSKQILYLEIHDANDGIKTFGVTTAYDFYCLHNVQNTMFTKIKCLDGSIERIDISKMDFIPNGMFSLIKKIIANKNDEKVEIIANSTYHTQRTKLMSKNKTEQFKYPCIDNVSKKGKLSCVWYSNNNTLGHFGKAKIIVGCFGINTFIDEKGEFGMTQHGIGIVDTVDNLKRIKEVLKNKGFQKLNKMTSVAGMKDVPLNHKVISLFRKDFWKEFQY